MILQKDWHNGAKKLKSGSKIDVTRDVAKKLIDKGILTPNALPDYSPAEKEKEQEKQETKEVKRKKVITK